LFELRIKNEKCGIENIKGNIKKSAKISTCGADRDRGEKIAIIPHPASENRAKERVIS
jgi:hypothetical protein